MQTIKSYPLQLPRIGRRAAVFLGEELNHDAALVEGYINRLLLETGGAMGVVMCRDVARDLNLDEQRVKRAMGCAADEHGLKVPHRVMVEIGRHRAGAVAPTASRG